MTSDETGSFVQYVDEAWNPRLTDTQKTVWSALAMPLDAKPAFEVILAMIRREKFRPAPPEFMQAYRQRLRDTTPVQPLTPSDRDELPEWVGGWEIARSLGDKRLWPEQEKGFRILHEEWIADSIYTKAQRQKHGLKSGYEWEENVADLGLMPQDDRLEYMSRWRESGRGGIMATAAAAIKDPPA